MVRWEYKVETQNVGKVTVDLGHLGNQGWELVTVMIFMSGPGLFERFYFKRRVD
jgi:hypothetical protein